MVSSRFCDCVPKPHFGLPLSLSLSTLTPSVYPMASTTAGEGTAYEEGGGGKLRKIPYRQHQATPYDRLPTTNPRDNRWLPKLVEPASKLIFATARIFFSSVFHQKCLPPHSPPRPPGAIHWQTHTHIQYFVFLRYVSILIWLGISGMEMWLTN